MLPANMEICTILCLIVITLLTYFYWLIKKSQSYWREAGVKYVEPKFLLGNLSLFYSKSFSDRTLELYNSFPEERYFGIYQFLQPTLLVRDPKLIKQMAIKEFDSFMDHRNFVPPEVDPLWNKNLFATTGNQWRDMRATLTPTFTSSKMKTMFVLIDECARQFVDYFKNHESNEIEMKSTVTKFTNDVIATTAFGLKCDSLENKNNEFYLMGRKASDLTGFKSLKFFVVLLAPFFCKLFRIKIIATDVAKYFTNLIKETISFREKNNIVRPDLLNLLMEARKARLRQEERDETTVGGNKKQITIDDIAAQAFVFFIAGFDPVSTLISFSFYELAVNPDVQSKLREEIRTVSSQVAEISYDTLQSMKYLEMVVAETLRKWPPSVFTDRIVTKPFTIQPARLGEKPLKLEPGTMCWFPVFGIHRDPSFYPDPLKFDPERFSEDNKRFVDPETFIPFGIGPRNCIGSRFALLETKLLIYHVIGSFQVVPVQKTNIPMVLSRDVPVTSKGGLWLGLKKIQ